MAMDMTIIMTMNIYIRPDLEELLRRYDGSMSGLVNSLLREFFEKYPSAASGVRREVDKGDEPPAPNLRIDATKGTAVTTAVRTGRFSSPVCKIHGLPLDARGRCLQKGCKYA